MNLIYIAGKYTADSHEAIQKNIDQAESLAVKCWAKGWAVICPHTNTAHLDIHEDLTHIDYDTWIEGTLEMLKRCDAIIMCENWRTSKGAMGEFEYAKKNNIPIFFEYEGVPDASSFEPCQKQSN
jgi:hypothetical protein